MLRWTYLHPWTVGYLCVTVTADVVLRVWGMVF